MAIERVRLELAALITALHRTAQRLLPIVLVGAGLPQLRGQMGRAKSYAERLFDVPEIGPLPEPAARTAIAKPVEAQGVAVEELASTEAVAALDESFFRVRFDRLTPAEKTYLRAMAELGPGPHRSGDIADLLGRRVTSLGPTRSQLIAKGMIWSPSHGDTAFTVPLFNEFMRRIVPGEGWKS